MLRLALAMLMIAGIAAWGQSQTTSSVSGPKVDRAAAYYHYALAHFYAENAGRDKEYLGKSIENYKAAVRADPRTPPMLSSGAPFAPRFPRLQAPRQDRTRP